MKVTSPLIEYFHLDPAYALLSIQNIMTALQVFQLIDVHGGKFWNDRIFECYMKQVSDLNSRDIGTVFRMLDVDNSGTMEFDEFYLLFCVMVACKDQYEKEFIYRHSQSIFDLIDADRSGQVSAAEFANMGILFNFDKRSVMSIFNEFDISGDRSLDFGEFRLFTMACIDEQRISDAKRKVTAFREYNHRLIDNLSPYLHRYIKNRHLPPPVEIEAQVESTRLPYLVKIYSKKNLGNKISDFFYKLKQWIVNIWKAFIQGCKKSRKPKEEVLNEESYSEFQKKPAGCCGRNRQTCCRRRRKVHALEEPNDMEGYKMEKSTGCCGGSRRSCCSRRKNVQVQEKENDFPEDLQVDLQTDYNTNKNAHPSTLSFRRFDG